MAKEKKTVIKTFIEYFAVQQIDETQDNPQLNYFKLQTQEEDYEPFITLDDTWTEVESIPDDLYYIKKTAATDDEGAITETEYYYAYYEKEIEIESYIKGICKNCKFFKELNSFVFTRSPLRKYVCTNEENTFMDHVTGKNIYQNCVDLNLYGQCRLYTSPEDESETDDNENTEQPDVDPVEPTSDTPTDDTGDDTTGDDNSGDNSGDTDAHETPTENNNGE